LQEQIISVIAKNIQQTTSVFSHRTSRKQIHSKIRRFFGFHFLENKKATPKDGF